MKAIDIVSGTASRFVLGALVLAFGFANGTAHAQDAKTVINAAVSPTYPPFRFKDPTNNELRGFDIDLLEAMAQKMGAKITWTQVAFQQYLGSLLTKRVDLLVDLADTQERRKSMDLLDYYVAYSVFFTMHDKVDRFPNAEALCGRSVSVERATTWPDQVTKWSDEHCTKLGKPPVVMVDTSSPADTLVQLKQGRVDAAVSGAGTLAYQNTLDNNLYMVIAKLNDGEMVGEGFAKDNPQLGQELKKALIAVIFDGTYKKLMRKWNLADFEAIERPMINGEP